MYVLSIIITSPSLFWGHIQLRCVPPKKEFVKHATTHDDGDRRILDLPEGLSTAMGVVGPSVIAPRPAYRCICVVNNRVLFKICLGAH